MRPDAESIAKRLAEILKSDEFNVVLAGIYEEKGEAQVDYPKDVYESQKWLPSVYPSGEVSWSGSTRQNPDDYLVDSVYNFDVYWHVQGAHEERLSIELSRLVRAVEDYFREVPNLLPLPGCSVRTGDSDASPLGRFRDTEPLVKSAIIQVFVRAQR